MKWKRGYDSVTNWGKFPEARRAVWATAATLIAAISLTALAPHDKDLRAAAVGLGVLALVVVLLVRVWGLPRAQAKPPRTVRP